MDDSVNDSDILERRVHCNLLYDFYSPLLTERQRKVYETLCFSDLTLSEAADVLGISRQGVYVLVRHVMEKLEKLEDGYSWEIYIRMDVLTPLIQYVKGRTLYIPEE